MRMKAILTATVSTVMFLTSIGSFPTFADTIRIEDIEGIENRETLLAELTPEQQELVEIYWDRTGSYDYLPIEPVNSSNPDEPFSSSIDWYVINEVFFCIPPKDYILPYSFEEFLALSDEEFLALEDVPEFVKRCYRFIRDDYNYDVDFFEGVIFRLNDIDIDFPVEGSPYIEDINKEEICKYLSIPSEIVEKVWYPNCRKGDIRLNVKEYNGHSAKSITNKLIIYMEFHRAVYKVDGLPLCGPCRGETSEITPGDLNCDGEVGVADVVMLQKWLLGSGNLPNWQNADLHQDGIINIFDLVLLKRMLIEK
ncbi:MAG: dockerin type I repeat-containing protein [Oscillospiraceae bacterium]|nr:dockerin type I repeat-containing protein [Oscillospiraceae bacterium]